MALMAEMIEKRLLNIVRTMPPERAAEVLDFAEFLQTREGRQANDVRAALDESFGIWRDRSDLIGDSASLVRAMRDEWQEREDRLGLR
ncbi:MAG: hypothetical protein A2Z04_07050 [Chloroflexi bacterium RBG_16_57_9]|nr:MAG: hypothetical protein A2Z04_07050 [Chloroflexi bacterium RBG_16_57_9]